MPTIVVNKNIQGGLPCFEGTRVPVSSLFDHLKKGYTINQFVEEFPTVSEAQVRAVLDMASDGVPKHAASASAP